jgi:hypothetical protein
MHRVEGREFCLSDCQAVWGFLFCFFCFYVSECFFVCLFLCPNVCSSIRLCLSLSDSLSVSLSLSLRLHDCVFLSLSVCLSICQIVILSAFSLSDSECLSVSPSFCIFICQNNCPSLYLYEWMFLCLSVFEPRAMRNYLRETAKKSGSISALRHGPFWPCNLWRCATLNFPVGERGDEKYKFLLKNVLYKSHH